MTLTGGEFAFEAPAMIALTGSDFGAGLPLWTPVEVAPARPSAAARHAVGARCYLAVRGGSPSRAMMGSASVHVMTGVGGRPLRARRHAADRRRGGAPPRGPACRLPSPTEACCASPPARRRDRFGDELYRGDYTVSEESNRMGLRLRGPAIPSPAGQMITEGVALGAVQVPPDGQPIILFVEHQTTGGYPKPANVISADFWRLGQSVRATGRASSGSPWKRRWRCCSEQEAWLYSLIRTMIDLNCDMGELEDAAHEAALMEHITSANIACGGHAGDEATMERTARLALERGVRIGAHPGYPDRANFGRHRNADDGGGDRADRLRADRAAGGGGAGWAARSCT